MREPDPFDDPDPPAPWQPESTLEYLGGPCDHDPTNPDE